MKSDRAVGAKIKAAESRRGSNGGQRGQPACSFMVLDQAVEVDGAHTITIGKHEALTVQPRFEALDATPRVGREACLHEMDDPVLYAER